MMKQDTCKLVDETAIRAILEQKKVATFFQPVVSIPAKAVVGFEAFSRPAGEECNVETRMLFYEGLSPDTLVNVDRLCRGMAIRQFKPFHDGHDGMLLFLKVNPEIFAHLDVDQAMLPTQLAEAGIAPESIVLECSIHMPHADRVMQFVELFRGMGIKLGLDGCCINEAFTHAINRVEPDFIKVNRTFFGENDRTGCSASVLETLLSVADRVGAQVIGQGVETEAESIRLLTAGVSFQQGYYYSKDESSESGNQAASLLKKIEDANRKYKVIKKELVRRKKERFTEAFRSVKSACSKLENMSEDYFEEGCKRLVKKSSEIVSVFVLDEDGMQITSRAHANVNQRSSTVADLLRMQKGADHSAQDYVLYLDMGYLQFVTKPFASPFRDSMSCLVSRPFFDKLGSRYTLCLEMPYPG